MYPVHLSRMFLSAPTLAAALYLVLVHFLDHQYEMVFQHALSCVTDVKMLPHEREIWNRICRLKDLHPDAHSCRLRILMATKPCRTHMPCGWSVLYEMEQYVMKRQHVAAACRLTTDEEITLLRQCKYYPQVSIHLKNRLALLEKLLENKDAEETLEVGMLYPRGAESPYCFETVVDGMILQGEVLRGFMSKAAAFT